MFSQAKNLWLTAILAWLSATGYAGLDEFHQMMTGGRTPMFQDVMLDSIGALTAVILCVLLRHSRSVYRLAVALFFCEIVLE